MRMLRDCFIFLLLIAAFLFGFLLTGVGFLRNPWTWILAVIGAAILEVMGNLVYRRMRRKKSAG